jgi:hypothetical protein
MSIIDTLKNIPMSMWDDFFEKRNNDYKMLMLNMAIEKCEKLADEYKLLFVQTNDDVMNSIVSACNQCADEIRTLKTGV